MEALLVSEVDKKFELGNGVVYIGEFASVAEFIVEKAGEFKVLGGCVDFSLIGDGIDGLRNNLAFAELYSKIFDDLGCGQLAIDCLEFSVQIIGSDVAIRGVKVCEKGQSGDVGKTEEIIAAFIGEDIWDGGNELSFKFASTEEYVLNSTRDAVNFRLVLLILSLVAVVRWRRVAMDLVGLRKATMEIIV